MNAMRKPHVVIDAKRLTRPKRMLKDLVAFTLR